MVEASGPRT
jgi:hypothetical protein